MKEVISAGGYKTRKSEEVYIGAKIMGKDQAIWECIKKIYFHCGIKVLKNA